MTSLLMPTDEFAVNLRIFIQKSADLGTSGMPDSVFIEETSTWVCSPGVFYRLKEARGDSREIRKLFLKAQIVSANKNGVSTNAETPRVEVSNLRLA